MGSRGNRSLLAVCTGILLGAAYPKVGLFPLAWVALVPMFYAGYRARPGEAFRCFFLGGWVFYSILLHWLMTNVYWAGGWGFWGYQALCVIMALYWGVLGMLWSFIRRRAPAWAGAVCLAAMWAAMEFFQSTLFSGFGWGLLAYSQGKDLWLLQWAGVGGAHLVSAILVFVNALLVQLLAEREGQAFRFLAAAAVVLVTHAVGMVLMAEADYESRPLRVGIVQADFPLEMKWDMEYTEEMVRNTAEKSRWLARYEDVDLFVWPESLVMTSVETPGIRQTVATLARDTGSAIFTGAIRQDPDSGGEFNSSYLIDAKGDLARYYDKVHLAPFGEYVPFGKHFPFVKKVVPAIGDIVPGEELKVFPVSGRNMGPLICFEVLFTDLAQRLREKGADVLVVITNLGWFGSSSALFQEIDIARVRAIENRLPLVHSANTGISGVFDPWGRLELVNAAFDQSGHYIKFNGDLRPTHTVMRRRVGAFAVAAPARRPLPYGPRVFPWAAVAISVALLAVALVTRGPRPEWAEDADRGLRLQ